MSDPNDYTLVFKSFDGGGPSFTVIIEDPSMLSYVSRIEYGEREEAETGSPFEDIITFHGLKSGETKVTIEVRSPIMPGYDLIYIATIGEDMKVDMHQTMALDTLDLYRATDMAPVSYHLYLENGRYYLEDIYGDTFPVDAAEVDKICKIYEEYELFKWDGFDESNSGVLDGESFSLDIYMTDGVFINVRGDNAFPENYFEVMGKLMEVLEGITGENE